MFWLLAIFAYLLGSLSFAILLSRLTGNPDPRMSGSGNAGATNMLRLAGKKLAIVPILLFIGLVIGAQAFQVSPKRHAPAVVLALVPNIAEWAKTQVDGALSAAGVNTVQIPAETLGNMANNGVLFRPHLVKYITDSKTSEKTMIDPLIRADLVTIPTRNPAWPSRSHWKRLPPLLILPPCIRQTLFCSSRKPQSSYPKKPVPSGWTWPPYRNSRKAIWPALKPWV